LRKEEDDGVTKNKYGNESTIFRVSRIVSYITLGLVLALFILAVIALILAIGYFIFEWIIPSVMGLAALNILLIFGL
jgi:tetrahydromethanopterin S-methyltransferase subunit B